MAFRISIADHDAAFDCGASQSILDAASAAGIDLPHACRSGLCGNCAGHIERGSVTGVAGAAVSSDLCEPGQVLFCTTTPTSDLSIRPRNWRRADASGRKALTAKVYRNTLAAPDVSVLQLRLPAGQRVKFRAGQHVRVDVGDGQSRCYSMANPPQESDAVTLHVRHVEGGLFSARVRTLAPGDPLQLTLPLGDFCVPDAEDLPLVFVAGGTGFAPIKSILDDFARRGLRRRITLVWGARQRVGLYALDAVAAWQKRWPDLRFLPALSAPDEASAAQMFSGRVDAGLAHLFDSLQGYALYCCGSPELVHSVLRQALRLGLARSDFHADAFVPAGR